jgi:hypothetical protein
VVSVKRILVNHLRGTSIEHQEVDALWEAVVAFGLATERQPPQMQPCRVAVVDVAPEVVVLAETIEAPIEVAEHHAGGVPGRPRRSRPRVLEAATVAPGFEVDAEQPKQLPVLLQEYLGAPSDWAAADGMDHAEARNITLADGIEHAPPDRKVAKPV